VEIRTGAKWAEAFAHIHGGEKVEAYAPVPTVGVVNSEAIEAMRELGYDSAGSIRDRLSIFRHRIRLCRDHGCGDALPVCSRETPRD